ncbi:glycosyltransferase family protein [Desulfocurvus sp. DL9XJH121]
MAPASPRVLFLRFSYFLERELMAAFVRSRAEVRAFFPEREARGPDQYVRALVERVAEFRPDVVFSVNFLGADENGALFDLLRRTGVRFATWFVDSPELFLHGMRPLPGAQPTVFCCDPDARAKLAPAGLANVHVLPLAADAARFDLDAPLPKPGRGPVTFVGSTWEGKLAATRKAFDFPQAVLETYPDAGCALARTDYQGPALDVLTRDCPDFAQVLESLDTAMQRGALHLACWEGNRLYRLDCVRRMARAPGRALAAGDDGWRDALGDLANADTAGPLGYYTPDLERLYREAAVNFCCSGVQMPGAVTQRAFDVPAAGGFLLTDRRRQMDELFEPGVESACYEGPEDIAEAVGRWLGDPEGRRALALAARRRIRAEHTYDHRVAAILDVLGQG